MTSPRSSQCPNSKIFGQYLFHPQYWPDWLFVAEGQGAFITSSRSNQTQKLKKRATAIASTVLSGQIRLSPSPSPPAARIGLAVGMRVESLGPTGGGEADSWLKTRGPWTVPWTAPWTVPWTVVFCYAFSHGPLIL